MAKSKTKEPLPPEPSSKQVPLHRAQFEFDQSPALFKALCGGIGSGKSRAGSYSLLRRSKPGRLYTIVTPTHGVGADSTLRMFLAVSQQLGVINMSKAAKYSCPCNIKLLTGAEVLFRSADRPQNLYGPNLSGLWLDEASLMDIEVFNIGIGRLREAGEQGWLQATFTPKGKANWTYQVFGTGRPDTAIFHAKTSDNPWLPERFMETVAGQYTSLMARQELGGEFVDSEGALFQRSWFKTVAAAPKIVKYLRAWDLASTPRERKSNDPDWSVGALLGKDEAGTVYILDIKRLRGSPQQVEIAVRQTAEMDMRITPIWMEEEGGSSGKIVSDHYARRVLNGWIFHAERSTGDKITRAQPFAAACERGIIKILEAHWNKDLLDEFSAFPYGGHDDIVDSCSLAFNKLAAKRELWLRVGNSVIDGRQLDKDSDYITVTNPKSGTTERVPFDPTKHIDLRPNARGWERRFGRDPFAREPGGGWYR